MGILYPFSFHCIFCCWGWHWITTVHQGTYFNDILQKSNVSKQGNAYVNVIDKIAAILIRPECIYLQANHGLTFVNVFWKKNWHHYNRPILCMQHILVANYGQQVPIFLYCGVLCYFTKLPLVRAWNYHIPLMPRASSFTQPSLGKGPFCKVSKPWNWMWKLSYYHEIWQVPQRHCFKRPVKFQKDQTTLTLYLVISRLHEIWR